MENIPYWQKLIIATIGITIGVSIILMFWAGVTWILAWAFKFEFQWSYAVGMFIVAWILTTIVRK